MSFFNDIFHEFGLDDGVENLTISYVEDKGVYVVGNFKVLTFNDQIINLKAKKRLIEIQGENLAIKSISKGELIVFGKILNIDFGEKKYE